MSAAHKITKQQTLHKKPTPKCRRRKWNTVCLYYSASNCYITYLHFVCWCFLILYLLVPTHLQGHVHLDGGRHGSTATTLVILLQSATVRALHQCPSPSLRMTAGRISRCGTKCTTHLELKLQIPCCRRDDAFYLQGKKNSLPIPFPVKVAEWRTSTKLSRDYFNPYQSPGQSKSAPGFKKLCKAFLYPCSHLQKATSLPGITSFWTLSRCLSSGNKVFAKDSPRGCSSQKWLVATVIKGLSSAACLPPFHVLPTDRASPQPGFSLVSASQSMLSCFTYWRTSERSRLQHLVHSKNHQQWDIGLCDRMTHGSANTCTTGSPS